MSNDYNRREFIYAASVGATLAVVSPQSLAAGKKEVEAAPALQSAFATLHQPKPLPFDPAKLDGISEKLIKSHWENNYGGAVKALNVVKQKLAEFQQDPNLPAYIYNDLKREQLLRTGSIVLHDLYFGNLGGHDKPDAHISKALTEAFGSVEAWEKEFRRIGAGLGGGSGWVVLGLNLHTGLLENYWQWDHQHAPSATLPILVLDVYEHAYQIDYAAATASYIDAYFRNINWEVASERLERARRAHAQWSADAGKSA
ncbi:superoxide dismutase [Methylococcus sp. EFPC2]|uniref:superoxide dismutase n=1 Tax=Methylococcus sp. EFPC2 TaxID=2812648 RepID=UPI001967BD67|nr:Fe-Mn family superoxide dismutase [Methylococcus sp. EFPC2]QSA96436.1 superoxide dismutase [Methylococcus sp. EFPC2]